jgi:hypothetical protein
VIDVRVGDKYEVDAGGVERKGIEVLLKLLVAALVHPAINQEATTAHLEQVARPSDLARGTTDLDQHPSSPLIASERPRMARFRRLSVLAYCLTTADGRPDDPILKWLCYSTYT